MSAILEGVDPYSQPSFSLKNRAMRAAWMVCYALFFRPSPRTFHAWRSMLLKCFGAKLGSGCHVYAKTKIWAPWNLVLGEQVVIGDDVNCYCMAQIVIGKKAIISQGTHLCTGTHDYEHPAFQLYALPIHIGENAWLCTETFVGPGVVIGEGAVIGARSVVTKNMPAWTVCVGQPCKPLKPRVIRS